MPTASEQSVVQIRQTVELLVTSLGEALNQHVLAVPTDDEFLKHLYDPLIENGGTQWTPSMVYVPNPTGRSDPVVTNWVAQFVVAEVLFEHDFGEGRELKGQWLVLPVGGQHMYGAGEFSLRWELRPRPYKFDPLEDALGRNQIGWQVEALLRYWGGKSLRHSSDFYGAPTHRVLTRLR